MYEAQLQSPQSQTRGVFFTAHMQKEIVFHSLKNSAIASSAFCSLQWKVIPSNGVLGSGHH